MEPVVFDRWTRFLVNWVCRTRTHLFDWLLRLGGRMEMDVLD